MTRLRLIALVFLAACSADRQEFAPVIDVPGEGSDGYPYDGIDTLVLSIARAGSETDLQVVAVPVGDELALPSVAYGDDLVVHLSGRAGDVEVAYGRTCATDVTADRIDDPAPHLYLSRIVKWAHGPDPIAIGVGDTLAARLPDGRALFLRTGSTPRAERFDPDVGAFESIDAGAIAPRSGGVLAPLADGRAVLVGGLDPDGDGVAAVEVIDPRAEPGPAGPLEVQSGPRLRALAAATLVDGGVLVVGGERQDAAGGAFAVTGAAWRIGFGDGGGLAAPEELRGAAVPRAEHTLTRLGDEVGADVLVAGGRDADGMPVAEVEIYRPLRDAFELVEGAALAVPRWGHRAVRLPGGSVLVVGGVTVDGEGDEVAVTVLELYDPIQGRFSLVGELPAAAGVTELAASTLPDGRVLLLGGRDATDQPVSTVLVARLDAVDGRVDLVMSDPLDTARAGHAAALLCDGTILVTGGSGADAAGSERYNPPSAGRR